MYGEVYSYGELRPGQRSWADLGMSSTRPADQGSTRSFRGRGPKGYQRSDERLLEAICEQLTDDQQVDASEISVAVSNGEVTLTGTVSDRQAKWRAEDIVESCSGVKGVDNRLRYSHRG
jgi:osmotically-inducible protein OsmY